MAAESSQQNTRFKYALIELAIELGCDSKAELADRLGRSRSSLAYWFRDGNFNLGFVLEVANNFETIPLVFADETGAPVLSRDGKELDPIFLLPYVNEVLPVNGTRHNYYTKVNGIEEIAGQRNLTPYYFVPRQSLSNGNFSAVAQRTIEDSLK